MAAQGHILQRLKRTPFHERIEALMQVAGWYDWAGYVSPAVIDDEELEYFAIRNSAALFDISPMVKYRIEGRDAEIFCNRLTVRDVRKLKPGRVQYTAWCDDDGYVLDDGTLFRLTPTRFRLCSQEHHLPWLLDTAYGLDVAITEETQEIAGLAIQGPTAATILLEAGLDVRALTPFSISTGRIGRIDVTVSRTGFTGDLGYELFCEAKWALDLWDRLMKAGSLRGIRAIGYHALNTARIEAGFIVANADFMTSGHALREDRCRTPDEIGLDWMVDMGKDHFTGRDAIERARQQKGTRYRIVGLEIDGKEPADAAIVYHRAKAEAGLVTAATWSPTAKRNIAIASLEEAYAGSSELWVEIYALRELKYHKMMKRARIVERPFLKLARRTQTPPADF
ncbi:MAG: aminomethyltransferase family protein [Rhizobiaceae bacterium]